VMASSVKILVCLGIKCFLNSQSYWMHIHMHDNKLIYIQQNIHLASSLEYSSVLRVKWMPQRFQVFVSFSTLQSITILCPLVAAAF
jgi:hypothetical protein